MPVPLMEHDTGTVIDAVSTTEVSADTLLDINIAPVVNMVTRAKLVSA